MLFQRPLELESDSGFLLTMEEIASALCASQWRAGASVIASEATQSPRCSSGLSL